MMNLIRRGAVVGAVVGSVALGASASAGASTETSLGSDVAAAPAIAAAPCGLDGSLSTGTPGTKIYSYTIRNCHSYTVKRRVVIARGSDGACHTIGPGQTVRGSVAFSIIGAVDGMKDCS